MIPRHQWTAEERYLFADRFFEVPGYCDQIEEASDQSCGAIGQHQDEDGEWFCDVHAAEANLHE
jgi:hypothetical protein